MLSEGERWGPCESPITEDRAGQGLRVVLGGRRLDYVKLPEDTEPSWANQSSTTEPEAKERAAAENGALQWLPVLTATPQPPAALVPAPGLAPG